MVTYSENHTEYDVYCQGHIPDTSLKHSLRGIQSTPRPRLSDTPFESRKKPENLITASS